MASNAEKELERIERELDSKAPLGKPPPTKGKLNRGSGESDSPAERSPKLSPLNIVIAGALSLAAIAFTIMLSESLSPKQKARLTAASMGGAVGLLIGYGVGRIKL